MHIDRNKDLIEFPCDFPLKIMGMTQDDFLPAVTEIVCTHDPDFDANTIETRHSSNGNYISVTATIRATSREQLDNIYMALTAHPLVKIVF